MTIRVPHHPGLAIRLNCIEPLGLTVAEAARRLCVSRKHLSAVINGRARVSPKMAIRLDKAFGGTADMWCKLQALHDVALAENNAGDIDVQRIYLSQKRDRARDRKFEDERRHVSVSA